MIMNVISHCETASWRVNANSKPHSLGHLQASSTVHWSVTNMARQDNY